MWIRTVVIEFRKYAVSGTTVLSKKCAAFKEIRNVY